MPPFHKADLAMDRKERHSMTRDKTEKQTDNTGSYLLI